ncbi:protein kinase [Dactylosporangium sp. AC04546]|uniref:serine/threonine-protein kinase n=1 Tax=Dactylosporangium sp. AC04546 TaxID=2862460 RepID=UPI001EDFB18A|nr:protein kinase [Dactylosporangium sp. AC04546]WVK89328.1 protein kinase [Dactylosporangium sp. AC04546]
MADTIAGRYRLSHVIGSGGMSRVWAATDELLDRPVAVKEILPVPGLTEDLWARTLQEGRAAARLAHPNVVRVYDVLFGDGRPWIVMEYLTCRSLDAVVRERGPLDPAEAARVALAVLDGLSAAHRAGVLHRDVKPANVLITADDRVLLGDFGIAVFDALPLSAGPVVASPAYVAPERVRDGLSTAHGDLWSFGATLYYAVEGRPPFSRPTTSSLLGALTSSPVDPLLRAGPLTPVVEGLLRRDPGERLTATRARLLLDALASADAPPPSSTSASSSASFAGRPALVRGRSPLQRLGFPLGRLGASLRRVGAHQSPVPIAAGTADAATQQGRAGTAGTAVQQGPAGTAGTANTAAQQGRAGTAGTAAQKVRAGTAGTADAAGTAAQQGKAGTAAQQGKAGMAVQKGRAGAPQPRGASGAAAPQQPPALVAAGTSPLPPVGGQRTLVAVGADPRPRIGGQRALVAAGASPLRRVGGPRALVAAGVAALLAGAAAAAVLSLPSRSSSDPSSAAPPAGCADPAAPPALPRAGATSIVGGPEPDGSITHTDPSGFRLALPSDWLRSTDAASVCFVDPAGQVRLTVTAAAAGGDREFSYDAAGRRWHTAQLRVPTGHLLAWTAGESEFPSTRSRFDSIARTFVVL